MPNFGWVGKLVKKIWGPVKKYARIGGHNEDDSVGANADPNLWSKDLERHAFGEFSFAAVQANQVMEDYSQVEVGQTSTFFGVYDGHGGPDAARFVSDNLFRHIIRIANDEQRIYGETVRRATLSTENEFMLLVRRLRDISPLIAAVGSCCLSGIIWRRKLIVGNLGDSRAIIGCVANSVRRRLGGIVAEQITQDHNASDNGVRRDLMLDHPQDQQIVVRSQGVWRIRGIIQVSRTIGDAYLKRPEFALGHEHPRFHVNPPIQRPVLRNDPSIYIRQLEEADRFLVFASDGLWDNVTNQQVVDIVHNNPRSGIARRLIKSAMKVAGKKMNKKYRDLKRMESGTRRNFHDDITVIVIFIDHELLDQNENYNIGEDEQVSVKGFRDEIVPSLFRDMRFR